MASTFSTNLRFELIGAGEQSGAWNNTTNTNIGTLIEQAICGVQDITVGAGDYTLEFANGTTDESRNMVLILGGSPTGSRNIIAPDVDKVYIVKNDTGHAHTIKTSSGTGVSVAANSSAIVFCDSAGNGTFHNAVEDLAAGATVGGVEITTISGTQTLTNKTLTAPKFADGGFIADANGNEIIVLDTVTSAVNEITVANAIAGSGPTISSTGSENDIDLLLVAKGTGVVKADGQQVATLASNTFAANQIISVTDNSNAALRVTQLGTGNAFLVEDSTNPDSTPFVINNAGRTTIGYTTVVSPVSGTPAGLGVHGDGTTTNTLSVFRWSNDTVGGIISASKSRGTSAGTQTVAASGDNVGTVLFTASDGTDFITAARIDAQVDGTPGTNDMPGRITFSTTADGASSATERFRIGSAGQLGIAGANYGTANQVLSSNGSSSAPSWRDALAAGTAVTSASGSEVPFTGIPSWVQRITISFAELDCNETIGIQVGNSSGYITTGYDSFSFTNGGETTATNCFNMRNQPASGVMTLIKLNSTTWVSSHAVSACAGGGSVTITGTLDRIRAIPSDGSGTFVGGKMNILYE